MKIKIIPKYFWSFVLNFTAPRYTILFLNSEIYIVHVINHEWNRSIFFASAVCVLYEIQTRFSERLGREIIPFPLICDLLPSPKVTLPHFLDLKNLKIDQSPVMCLEQLLSRYHKHVSITLNADFIMKHTSCLDD